MSSRADILIQSTNINFALILLNDRINRQLNRAMIKISPPRLRNLVKYLSLTVSHETVRKFLRKDGCKYILRPTIPKLKSADDNRRLEWAKHLVQKLSMGEIDVKTITHVQSLTSSF